MLLGQSHQCKEKLQAENETYNRRNDPGTNFLNSHYEKICARCTLQILNIKDF